MTTTEHSNRQSEYLDPRWQRRRLEIMQRDGFKCRLCGDDKETLNVHHLYYLPGQKKWEYDDAALVTLCRSCHLKWHEMVAVFFQFVGLDLEFLARITEGILASPSGKETIKAVCSGMSDAYDGGMTADNNPHLKDS